MNINNIEFPNEIIESLHAGRLVVFAGAGVSMGKPTNLPSFKTLANQIARYAGIKRENNESYEAFLGRIKAENGTNVNEIAVDCLKKCEVPNKLHKAIIDLFENADDLKIVTTNYDQMFEQVLKAEGKQTMVYDAPALPLGSDVRGIIHLHGNISNPNYMVLTDEDFGHAYLTDDYASRFLVKLFEKYDVLFVGYSFNDTVVKYLTRAMMLRSSNKKYILTDKGASSWDSFGIVPIPYPNGKHDDMAEALKLFADRVRMNLTEWKSFFVENIDFPPRDLTSECDILYCLGDYEKSVILSQTVSSYEWLCFLRGRGVFNNLYSSDNSLNQFDLLWGNWLADNFIDDGREPIIELLADNNSKISSSFVEIILRRLILGEKDVKDNLFSLYITLFIDYIDEDYLIYNLLDAAFDRRLPGIYWLLYKRLFRVDIVEQKERLFTESVVFKHKIETHAYMLLQYWDKNKSDLLRVNAIGIIQYFIQFVEELHLKYSIVGEADCNKEPWNVSMFPIEDRGSDYFFDGLYVVVDIIKSASIYAQSNHKVELKGLLLSCISSESIFLRKIGLIAIRETNVFSSLQKQNLIINNNLLQFHFGEQQVKKLVVSVYDNLSSEQKDRLIDYLEKCEYDSSEFENARYKYMFLRYIDKQCKNTRHIKSILKRINDEYDFESYIAPTPPARDPKCTMTASDIVQLDDNSLEELLLFADKPDVLSYVNDLLNELSKAAESSLPWAEHTLSLIIKLNYNSESVINQILYGVNNNTISPQDRLDLLRLLCSSYIKKSCTKAVSEILLNLLKMDDISSFFNENETELFKIAMGLWEYRSIENNFDEVLMRVLNTSVGILLNCFIWMFFLSGGAGISNQYVDLFERCLALKGDEHDLSLCVLCGHYNYFYYRDAAWCQKVFDELLIGKDKESFNCCWTGFVYYSGRININTVDTFSKVFLKAVKNLQWISGDARDRFLSLYLTLCIHVIKNPNTKYIPELYKGAEEKDILHFISDICSRLNKMDSKHKKTVWNKWLKQFLINRSQNKPSKVSDVEKQSLINMLPCLEEFYDEAVVLYKHNLIPKELDFLFIEKLVDNNLSSGHQSSTCDLITTFLESDGEIKWGYQSVIKLIQSMTELDDVERDRLNNALLKRGIQYK